MLEYQEKVDFIAHVILDFHLGDIRSYVLISQVLSHNIYHNDPFFFKS